MPTLLLLRHAKSSWADPNLSDHARPLAPRGRQAAKRLARYVDSHGLRPELVLCSSAQRARETLELLRPALGPDVDVGLEDELYGADTDGLVRRLRAVGNHVESVLLVGHNPGLQDLAVSLAGDGEPKAMQLLRTKFPTAALAILDVGPTGWTRLGPGAARLTQLVLPRELPVEPDERPV